MNRFQILAELAFAIALSDQLLPTLPNSRFKALLLRLSKACVTEVKKLKRITDSERQAAARMVLLFADKTKWEGKPLHICTKVNFMLALYDTRKYGAALIPILNEIYDYFARIKDAPKACEWSAALAMDKWEEVLKECQ